MPSLTDLAVIRAWLRRRLIADWRRGWRFWSVRLEALAIASEAWLAGAPEAATQIWIAIPADMRAMLPPSIAHALPLAFGLLALVARFIKQRGASE